MRVDAREMMQYDPADISVYLDGKSAQLAIAADDQEGWIEHYVRCESGALLMKGNKPVIARTTGTVRIVIGAGWHPTETAPAAMHVLAARHDPESGEWIMGIVMSPPAAPWTHWRVVDPPIY